MVLLEGIPSDPASSVVDAGAQLARVERCEVVIAIGGGSVIDAAKALALIVNSRTPVRSLLSGVREADTRLPLATALPLIAIPTLFGSGSETNGTSVLRDDETGRKLSLHDPLLAPRVALIDPGLSATAPRHLVATGYADAVCHALESMVSRRRSISSELAAEEAVRVLMRDAADALAGDASAHARCAWATTLAGQALSLAGSIVTHPLAHPISARLGARHADSVIALEPVVLAMLARRLGDASPRLRVWFGSRAQAADGVIRAVVNRLAGWHESLQIDVSLQELGLDESMIDQCIADALASGSRGLANTPGPPLMTDELRAMYVGALRGSSTRVPRDLVGALPAGQ